tara:strand:+ start:667 stop:804 length:138 start_codon:yes stop_codon:yes gene_type:complete
MDKNSIVTLIDYLPLTDLDKEVINLLSSEKTEEEMIEFLIERFKE